MPLPSNAGTGTVVGKFTNGDATGTPASGTVTFTPSVVRISDATSTPPTTILTKPTTVTLDSAGAFTKVLLATDDADLNPTDWTYTATFNLTGVDLDPQPFELPQGTTVDLTVVATTPASNGTVITQGTPGVGIATGGLDGQILAKNSNTNYDTTWVDPDAAFGDNVLIRRYSGGFYPALPSTVPSPAPDLIIAIGPATPATNNVTGGVVAPSWVGTIPGKVPAIWWTVALT